MINPFRIFNRGEKAAPEGFGRISQLPISTKDRQFDLLVLDWRPLPPNDELSGCFFFWLEVDGKRSPYFLSEEEARHIEIGPQSVFTHLRVVNFKGRHYALPTYPNRSSKIGVLPPPPKSFPPLPRRDAPVTREAQGKGEQEPKDLSEENNLL